jgi:hypothetical protein
MSEFTTNYAHLADDELFRLYAERNTLVPEAATALEMELRRRGLNKENADLAALRIDETAAPKPIMLRALKFSGFLLINVVVAIIGTAILDTALHGAIPAHTVSAILWKETFLSVICAGGIGFSLWRIWPNSASKWTWVLPSAWFAVAFLALTAGGHVFGRLFGFSSDHFGAPEIRSFFAFTVPFIRGVFYSLGAYISSLIYSTPVAVRS